MWKSPTIKLGKGAEYKYASHLQRRVDKSRQRIACLGPIQQEGLLDFKVRLKCDGDAVWESQLHGKEAFSSVAILG